MDAGVAAEEDQEGVGRRGIGGDEFEPGEGEEPGSGGPQTEPRGKGAARSGVASQGTADEEVDGAQRVDRPPDGTEQERGRDQPDPQQYVYGAGGRVAVRVVGAEEELECDVQGGGEAERPQGDTGGPGVGEALEGGRDGRPARSPRNREADQSRPSARKETKSAAKAPAKA